MLDEFVTIYFDDVLIYSGIKAKHGVHLHRMFDCLCEEILFIKCKKCKSGKDSIKYLGNIVRQGHMRMNPSKVHAITK